MAQGFPTIKFPMMSIELLALGAHNPLNACLRTNPERCRLMPWP